MRANDKVELSIPKSNSSNSENKGNRKSSHPKPEEDQEELIIQRLIAEDIKKQESKRLSTPKQKLSHPIHSPPIHTPPIHTHTHSPLHQASTSTIKNPPNINLKQSQNINWSHYEYIWQKQSYKKSQNSTDNKTVWKSIINDSLMNKQVQINIDKSSVYFPYEPYELQIKYMKQVITALNERKHALLQSPTGTGKTLCLLCSVLSWVEHYSMRSQKQIKVIYLSRTHTQLKQVQNQLQKTCFRPTIANFGSRDQYCIKEQFSEIKGKDLVEACSKGVKLGLKAKRRLQIERFNERFNERQDENNDENNENKQKNGEMQEQIGTKQNACLYYKSQSEYLAILQKNYLNKIIDSSAIKREGKIHSFCPYYYPFQIKSKANLIFMPYNYLLDVTLLPKYRDLISGSILIFDEAHNVPDSACEGRSNAIASNIFQHVLTQIDKLLNPMYVSTELKIVAYEHQGSIQMIQRQAKEIKQKISATILKISNNNRPFDYQNNESQKILKPNEMQILFYQWFGTINFSEQRFSTLKVNEQKSIFRNTLENLNNFISQSTSLIESLKQTYDGVFHYIQKFTIFLSKIQQLLASTAENRSTQEWWTQEINHYRLSIKINREHNNSYQVKLVCLTPSLTFTDILELSPHSILFTSGTLSPLDSWRKQLRINFQINLVNKHVIKPDQLQLAIVRKTIKNNLMNFSFNQIKERPQIFEQLVESIITLAGIIPSGVLVIFPSYKIIKSFKDQLKESLSSLQRLKDLKELCFEDKGSADYVLLNFKNKARTKKGAMLFCVCRGKISEGLDFSDDLCRAVIFVGVPYPNIKDPILNEKRQYYDKLSKENKRQEIKCLTGDQWYNLNTMRVVNQGIGRVIRHINDYGMIFLLDNRYEQKKLKSMLPAWAHESMTIYDDFLDLQESAQQFYNTMKIQFPSPPYVQSNEVEQFSQSNTHALSKKQNITEIPLIRMLKGKKSKKQSKSNKKSKKNPFNDSF